IVEKDTMGFIDGRLAARLFPEIRKAFQYPVTRRERMRIGCYTGSRGGELRFPEYGDLRYRPGTGAAIVFSSSILHEAMEVRAGRRFVLLVFLYGDY
ncbi:MAG TPA: 2OG-Fe(II) oxygenase, partial [Stellaceae bacterium]|nr:2OG-Fe(II) oxygenase [Stellaceae bacterium]